MREREREREREVGEGRMEGGPSRSPSCMMGFGENSISNGLSSMVMMTSSNAQETNTLFLPLNNNNHNQNSSNSQRDSTTLMPQDSMNNNHNAGCYFMESNNNNHDSSISSSMKAKIMAHPHFPRLLAAYINCQKVGAPPEVVARLEEACGTEELAMSSSRSRSSCIGEDPALDQFMEAYCEMLTKYEQELTKPFKEAMLFFSRIECQFKSLTIASSDSACGNFIGRNGLPEEEVGASDNYVDPLAEDKELKGQLLRKYSGYLGSLKQDFLKKKKKGKLPKEARHQLLEWWSRHYKWPYPSESQKLALAESTGLDQKQINNWFINQRKRHWKPSEDMQFVVMDGTHPHYYMESVMGNPYPMDCTPSLI